MGPTSSLRGALPSAISGVYGAAAPPNLCAKGNTRLSADIKGAGKHGNYASDVAPLKKQIPLGVKEGRTMRSGNNCLTQMLMQHATGTPQSAANADSAKKSAAACRATVARREALRKGLLDPQEWRGPISTDRGGPVRVCMSRHTSMDVGGQAVARGFDDDVQFLSQEGFNDVVPIWRKPAGSQGTPTACPEARAALFPPSPKTAAALRPRRGVRRRTTLSRASGRPGCAHIKTIRLSTRHFEIASKRSGEEAAAATAVAEVRKARLEKLGENSRKLEGRQGVSLQRGAYVPERLLQIACC